MTTGNDDRAEFTRWWLIGLPLLVLTIVVLGALTFGMQSCGTVAGTVIERKTYENSYQNSEARKTEIMTMEAQLADIDSQLGNPDLDDATRRGLEGQRRAINVRLRVAREKLDKVWLKD